MTNPFTARLFGIQAAVLLTAAAGFTAAGAPGDYWLQRYGLPAWAWDFDHDNDGFTTRQEYYFGTDPASASSHPPSLSAKRDGEEVVLSWFSPPGARYLLGRSPTMDAWTNFGLSTIGTGTNLTTSFTPLGAQEFFRLEAEPPTDADADGLSSIEEGLWGTNPEVQDTDGDRLSDGMEVFVTFTNPLVADPPGGTIAGLVKTDPNGDGDPADGVGVAGAMVFLDSDFDGEYHPGEPRLLTAQDGSFSFTGLSPGAYHLRQILAPGQLQTLPAPGASPVLNRLPDQVVNYTDGVGGTMAGPHGVLADPTAVVPQILFPGEIVAVDPAITLKPIGQRGLLPPVGVWSYNEFITLPKDASILLRFDEVIVDRAGPDLVIHTITQGVGEMAGLELGLTENTLVNAGKIIEQPGAATTSIPIDLATLGINSAVQYLRLTSLTNAGSGVGFELVGAEVIHFVKPAADARLVIVTGTETHAGEDFARHFRDDPPGVFLFVDGTDFRAGQSASATVQAEDDVAVAARTLAVNGVPIPLDGDGRGSFPLKEAGLVTLLATVMDSAGQVSTNDGVLYVINADGSSPFSANLAGAKDGSAYNLRIITPASGAVVTSNTPIVVNIEGLATPRWTLEYASVDQIDPYQLSAADSDWILLNSGSGYLANQAAGMFPANMLSNGIYFLRLSATPMAGGVTTHFGQVVAKGVTPEEIQPRVVFTSPAQGSTVPLTVEIRGSIRSARRLTEWFADYAPSHTVDLNNLGSDEPPWVRFASGTNTIDSNVIARLDASLLQDGTYIVRVVAWNDIRLGWAEPLPLEVANGGFKPGRLRREFTDLNLPVGGIPFTIRRIYDSLDANRDQGLGFGWSHAFLNPSINETVAQTGSGMFGATPFRDGTRVYLNTPEGRRVGFTFHAEAALASFVGTLYRAVFTPDPGVYEKLETPEGSDPFLTIDGNGNAFLFFLGLAWNPSVYILTTPEGIRYTYDQGAGFVEARDKNGNSLSATASGLRHSNGTSVNFMRDAANRITQINAPNGVTVRYGYGIHGDLATVTDHDGRVTTMSYYTQPSHYLKDVTDPLGRVGTTYEYDANGRLIAVIDEDGNRSEQRWSPDSFTGSITDRNGNVTHLVYDSRGNILEERNALGQVTTYSYSDPANPDKQTSRTDARGNRTTWTYDPHGNATAINRPLDSSTATYNADGKLLTATGFDSQASAFTYDSRGNLASSSVPGKPQQTYEYSPEGRRVAARVAEPGGPGRVFSTLWTYDSAGKVTSVSNDHGFQASMSVAANGDLTNVTLPGGRTFSFGYDADGSPNRETDPNGAQTTSSLLPDGTRRVRDRLGRVTDYHTSADELPQKVTLPNGAIITLGRDGERNLTNVTDAAGNSWRVEYDALNRPVRFLDPVGASSSIAYDAAGNVVEMINRNGKRRSFVYDDSDRLTRERWHDPSGAIIREFVYTYTPAGFVSQGALNQVTDGAATWSFNGLLPRPGSVIVAYPGQVARTISYSWDQNGIGGQGTSGGGCCGAGAEDGGAGLSAPTQITVSGGLDFFRITATYDGPKLTRLQWSAPDEFFGPEIQFIHNSNGELSEARRFHGPLRSRSTYQWDALGRLINYSHVGANNLPLHNNVPTTITRDAASRITAITRAGDTATYGYDELDQLVHGANMAGMAESYTYDLAGVRTASRLIPGPASVGPANRLLPAGAFSFVYDAEGNVTEKTHTASGEVTRYTYDHRNQLSLATVHPNAAAPASVTVAYEYDYEGRMMSRSIDGAKAWILYDRQMPIAEFANSSNAVNAAFLYSPNRLDDFHASWRLGVGQRFFLKDHLGTVLGATDADGVLRYWSPPDAFGNTAEAAPAGMDPIRFAGRFFNETLGLYEMRARFYDPLFGRFTQEDPLGLAGGDVNLYRYAGNNPLQFHDPTGQNAALEYVTLAVALIRPANLCNLSVCVAGILNGVANSIATLSPTQQGSAACIGGITGVPVPKPGPLAGSVGGAALGGAAAASSGQAGPFGQIAGAGYCAAKAAGYVP